MLKEYLLTHLEDTKRLVNEINAYNGALEHLIVYENDEEFFNTFYENEPNEAVKAVYFGKYSYMDEYVKFDGYCNLETLDIWQYNKLIEDNIDNIIKEAIKHFHYISIDKEELQEILEESIVY